MTTNLNTTDIILGTLFKVETVEGVNFYFQNFFKDDEGVFLYDGNEWQYIAIDYNPSEKNITMDNFENNIGLPNIPLLLNLLDSQNYFINAVVETFIVLKGFPTYPVISNDKGLVTSYNIQDDGISLVIQAPDNAVNAVFPNYFFITGIGGNTDIIGYIPEVPISNNASLG